MTISLAAVFIPLVFMTGLVGRIFREFAITIVIAIFASGLVSLTLTPLMCARLLKERGEGIEADLDGARDRRHREARARASMADRSGGSCEHRWVSAVIWVVCLAGHDLVVHARSQSVPAAGRQQRDLRRLHRAEKARRRSRCASIQDRVDEMLHAGSRTSSPTSR